MSTLDPQTLRRELLLDQAINQQLDELVRQATATMLVLGPNTSMEESQLRNLLTVAVEQRSVEVVANFIRYQIGRKERDWGIRPNEFGHSVVKDLYGKVQELATAAIDNVKANLTAFADQEIAKARDAADQAQVKQRLTADIQAAEHMHGTAHVRLMQLYLGYLNRAFYFYKKMQDRSAKERDQSYQRDALSLLQETIKQEVPNAG